MGAGMLSVGASPAFSAFAAVTTGSMAASATGQFMTTGTVRGDVTAADTLIGLATAGTMKAGGAAFTALRRGAGNAWQAVAPRLNPFNYQMVKVATPMNGPGMMPRFVGPKASNAVQGARLRAQLAAEETAGARLPQGITGYTRHGLNQAISRDGVGVANRAIKDAFTNPTSIAGQRGGTFKLTGRDATVIVNSEGKVVTTWATNSTGYRTVP